MHRGKVCLRSAKALFLTPCRDSCTFHTALGFKYATVLKVSRSRTFMCSQMVLIDGPRALLLILTAAEP